MNLIIRATYPATDGSAPESIEVEHVDLPGGYAALPYLTDHVVATVNALAAVSAGPVRPAPVVTVTADDDEHITVHVGDVEVATANHDEHGWSGMDQVIRTARSLAAQLGATFEDKR